MLEPVNERRVGQTMTTNFRTTALICSR